MAEVVATVQVLPESSEYWMLYPVMADPSLSGSVQDTVEEVGLSEVALTPVGIPGAPGAAATGVEVPTEVEVLPWESWAYTLSAYVVPGTVSVQVTDNSVVELRVAGQFGVPGAKLQ